MIKGYIKNHEIISFVFFTFLCSWTMWGILYGSSIGIINNVIYKSHMSIFIWVGAFGPSTMSIILTGFLYKRKGLKALIIRLTKWRYNLIYYIIAAFYWMASLYISYLICKFCGSKGEMTFTNVKPYYILEGFMITLFLGGPLGEEIGWRGFLLPRLQKKLNPFYSSIVLGIIWSCWHLPLFFIVGTDQYGVPFLFFIMTTTINAIIITWIFNRTNGSLIFPILFHTCNNVAIGGIIIGSFNFALANIYKFGIVQIIIMIFVVRDMFKQSKFSSTMLY